MLQLRQIFKAVGNQIDIEDIVYSKNAAVSFRTIDWLLIFDHVTIKRNAAVLQRHENNHCITTTKLLVDVCRTMNSIIESFGPTAAAMGGGFFVGVLIGYALKKVIKIVAVIIGLFLAGLAYLQYHQIANINWYKLQQVSEGAITTLANLTMQIPIISGGTVSDNRAAAAAS